MKKYRTKANFRNKYIWYDEEGNDTPCAQLKTSQIRKILKKLKLVGVVTSMGYKPLYREWLLVLNAELQRRKTRSSFKKQLTS